MFRKNQAAAQPDRPSKLHCRRRACAAAATAAAAGVHAVAATAAGAASAAAGWQRPGHLLLQIKIKLQRHLETPMLCMATLHGHEQQMANNT